MKHIRPRVISFVQLYVGALGALYWLMAVFLSFLFVGQVAQEDAPEFMAFVQMFLLGLLVFLGAAFLAFFLCPVRKWSWVYGLVLIALGFTSLLIVPFSVALLVYWLKPEVRKYYGFKIATPIASPH